MPQKILRFWCVYHHQCLNGHRIPERHVAKWCRSSCTRYYYCVVAWRVRYLLQAIFACGFPLVLIEATSTYQRRQISWGVRYMCLFFAC